MPLASDVNDRVEQVGLDQLELDGIEGIGEPPAACARSTGWSLARPRSRTSRGTTDEVFLGLPSATRTRPPTSSFAACAGTGFACCPSTRVRSNAQVRRAEGLSAPEGGGDATHLPAHQVGVVFVRIEALGEGFAGLAVIDAADRAHHAQNRGVAGTWSCAPNGSRLPGARQAWPVWDRLRLLEWHCRLERCARAGDAGACKRGRGREDECRYSGAGQQIAKLPDCRGDRRSSPCSSSPHIVSSATRKMSRSGPAQAHLSLRRAYQSLFVPFLAPPQFPRFFPGDLARCLGGQTSSSARRVCGAGGRTRGGRRQARSSQGGWRG